MIGLLGIFLSCNVVVDEVVKAPLPRPLDE
jgi:hypothetical protein